MNFRVSEIELLSIAQIEAHLLRIQSSLSSSPPLPPIYITKGVKETTHVRERYRGYAKQKRGQLQVCDKKRRKDKCAKLNREKQRVNLPLIIN